MAKIGMVGEAEVAFPSKSKGLQEGAGIKAPTGHKGFFLRLPHPARPLLIGGGR